MHPESHRSPGHRVGSRLLAFGSLVVLSACAAGTDFVFVGADPGSNDDTGDPADSAGVESRYGKLLWPMACSPDSTCDRLGYPDIDGDGLAFDCGPAGYTGHDGTDISTTWRRMDQGVDVYAAAPGRVLFAFDGKYDRCPDDHPDCAEPVPTNPSPGQSDGYRVCTELGDYCGQGNCCCYWCFAGGNIIVIRHADVPGVFATRYGHLRQGSVLVAPGDSVDAGQKIAEVGSSGNSTGPHLHFEVWGDGFYEPRDPWSGPCGADSSLWAHDPPWSGD